MSHFHLSMTRWDQHDGAMISGQQVIAWCDFMGHQTDVRMENVSYSTYQGPVMWSIQDLPFVVVREIFQYFTSKDVFALAIALMHCDLPWFWRLKEDLEAYCTIDSRFTDCTLAPPTPQTPCFCPRTYNIFKRIPGGIVMWTPQYLFCHHAEGECPAENQRHVHFGCVYNVHLESMFPVAQRYYTRELIKHIFY